MSTFIKDHLGSTWVAFERGTGETAIALQRSGYYPLGLRQTPYNPESENKYLYNGKGIQDKTGWYDYGARFYDASLGRWHAVDPLAEMYCSTSPYAYVGNNPIKFLDPDGRIWVDLHGNIVFENGAYTSHATSEHRAIGAALRETRTGRQQFDKLVNSENYVAINVEQVHKSRDGLENDAHRGRFNANQFRRDGEWSVGESSLANPYVIDLFLDGIRRYAKQQGVGFMEALAAVLGHEIEHNEDYNLELMQMWYNMPNPGSIPYEQRMHESIPHAIRQEIINQSKENNQPIRGSSWSDIYQFINANNLWDRVTVE